MTTASDPNLGVVYFIHDPDSRAVKIGWSGVGAGKRLAALNDARPKPTLKLIGVIPDSTIADERRMHARFGMHRIRREWFDDAILEAVRLVLDEGMIGKGMNVGEECHRRGCRHGLRGVRVVASKACGPWSDQGEVFTVEGTFWGATGQLYLILACGNERPFPGPADQYELASSWAACRTCEGATE